MLKEKKWERIEKKKLMIQKRDKGLKYLVRKKKESCTNKNLDWKKKEENKKIRKKSAEGK